MSQWLFSTEPRFRPVRRHLAEDDLQGVGGDDVLRGKAGDDRLDGGVGADRLDGGEGVDTAVYTHSSAAVSVSLKSGRGSGGDASGDDLTRIENLVGSAFDDRLIGSRLPTC